jgi:hypothetical protein
MALIISQVLGLYSVTTAVTVLPCIRERVGQWDNKQRWAWDEIVVRA